MPMKNSNDTIGNRTIDHPGCSAVTQPTAPPRACRLSEENNIKMDCKEFGYDTVDMLDVS